MKAYFKNEIARAAGVSTNTLGRWLAKKMNVLEKMGVRPIQRLLPPRAVRYICHEYGISEEDLLR